MIYIYIFFYYCTTFINNKKKMKKSCNRELKRYYKFMPCAINLEKPINRRYTRRVAQEYFDRQFISGQSAACHGAFAQ